MDAANYTTSFLVNQSPADVFKCINDPRSWWSREIEGITDALNVEFDYHYLDVHRSKMRIIELVPNQKVVWLVLENHFKFTKDPSEWVGDTIIFEISTANGQTRLQFTQVGLTPANECFDICNDAWNNYMQNSLKSLIETGVGMPNSKDEARTATEEQFKKS